MSYLTACLSPLPAVNRGTRRFGILMGAPVRGLRAVRALRFETLNVPKPTNETGSPFFSDLVMPSMIESIAAAAVVFVMPVSLAILATTSCLFTHPPHERIAGRDSTRNTGARFAQNAESLYATLSGSVKGEAAN